MTTLLFVFSGGIVSYKRKNASLDFSGGLTAMILAKWHHEVFTTSG
jgi:hypothetical protein